MTNLKLYSIIKMKIISFVEEYIIMKQTILKIKMLYPKMGKAEKKIAEWIIENPNGLIPLSITELAEKCGCGEATIVRFAKRLDFGGYQELKISIAREEGTSELTNGITATDSCCEIFEKVSNDIYCSLELTKGSLNQANFDLAANIILNADQIAIYGLGNSSAVALDFQHKLLRVGCRAAAFSDNHMQVISASHLTDRDVAVGISHSGSSKDIVDALKIARERGAKTISITNKGKSPIVKVSDIALFTVSNETQYSILGLNSRISQLAIISSIYYYIVNHKDISAEAVKMTEKALQNKKF